jgi:hypothetical protein
MKRSLSQLAAVVEALPLNGRGHRRYGDALRQEIMAALASSGLSMGEFAGRVGISDGNLARWKGEAETMSPRMRRDAFKTIEVADPAPSTSGLTLRGPSGLVIEGLTLDECAALLRAVGGGSGC